MTIKSAAPPVMALVFSAFATQAFAAAREADLIHLSLELLVRIHVPPSGKSLQPVLGPATAIYVIDAEDLRRSGAKSAPEALRLVPGLSVARIDGSRWAVSTLARGRRRAGKPLVSVDGRSSSGLLWETPDTPLAPVERVEVVRGPGAALWGGDAVNGVVNIVTCASADARGRCDALAAPAPTEPKLPPRLACRF